MKTRTKAFLLIPFLVSILSRFAQGSSEALHGSRTSQLIENASPPLDDEAERKKALAKALADQDVEGVLAYANPTEMTDAVKQLYGDHPEGSAHQMTDGSDVSQFKARIDIYISVPKGTQQHLEMRYPDKNGKMKLVTAIGSGGREVGGGKTFSDVLKTHCFVVDEAVNGNQTTVHGDTVVEPIWFRGKHKDGEWEVPGTKTYAIHGLLGEGYMSKLGGPASHGCFRVSRPDAKTLRTAVTEIGASNTVVCVH